MFSQLLGETAPMEIPPVSTQKSPSHGKAGVTERSYNAGKNLRDETITSSSRRLTSTSSVSVEAWISLVDGTSFEYLRRVRDFQSESTKLVDPDGAGKEANRGHN